MKANQIKSKEVKGNQNKSRQSNANQSKSRQSNNDQNQCGVCTPTAGDQGSRIPCERCGRWPWTIVCPSTCQRFVCDYCSRECPYCDGEVCLECACPCQDDRSDRNDEAGARENATTTTTTTTTTTGKRHRDHNEDDHGGVKGYGL